MSSILFEENMIVYHDSLCECDYLNLNERLWVPPTILLKNRLRFRLLKPMSVSCISNFILLQ